MDYDKEKIEAALGVKLDDDRMVEHFAKVAAVEKTLAAMSEEASGATLFGVNVEMLSRDALLGGMAVIGQQMSMMSKFQFPAFNMDALRRVFDWENAIEEAVKSYKVSKEQQR